jgi:hypothetical protein
MAARMRTEAIDSQKVSMLWKMTSILSNLRYDQETILPLMEKAMSLIKEEDFVSFRKGIRETIVRQGTKKFGVPDNSTIAILEAITRPDRLRFLSERLLEVSSWRELVADEITPRAN